MIDDRSRRVFGEVVCQRPSSNDHRLTTNDRKGYNSSVNAPATAKPAAGREHRSEHPSEHPDDKHRHRHSIYAAEATGLLLMAILLLILTLIRYWRDIPWSAR